MYNFTHSCEGVKTKTKTWLEMNIFQILITLNVNKTYIITVTTLTGITIYS
jgi:hypothetical protein